MGKQVSPVTLIDWALPLVRRAGRYALQIQREIGIQPAKSQFGSPFAQALTDADLSVQTLFEVGLLSDYPVLSFYGEEEDKSYNAKYFGNTSPYWVLLDPIDGTRFYMDGHANFHIIFSLLGPQGFEAAIVSMPALNQIFFADRERGAWVQSGDAPPEPLRLSAAESVIVTYQGQEIRDPLAPAFQVVDISQDYSPMTGCLGVSGILLGQACGIYGRSSALIDWGAMAYVVEQAGGRVSDRWGEPVSLAGVGPRYRYSSLVVSVNPQIHQQIIDRLRA